MLGRVDMIIDGGECDFGLESTIVRIDSENSVTLLRPGKITVDDIENLGITVNISNAVLSELREGERAESPGMKYRHYAPKSPVILIDGDFRKLPEYIYAESLKSVGIIAFSEDLDYFRSKIPNAHLFEFCARDDEFGQAHNLFDILRSCDKESLDIIFAPLPNTEGIGMAIYNRLIRASAYQIKKL
jgi:L-threonylcarbamoyladenylate synthase